MGWIQNKPHHICLTLYVHEDTATVLFYNGMICLLFVNYNGTLQASCHFVFYNILTVYRSVCLPECPCFIATRATRQIMGHNACERIEHFGILLGRWVPIVSNTFWPKRLQTQGITIEHISKCPPDKDLRGQVFVQLALTLAKLPSSLALTSS